MAIPKRLREIDADKAERIIQEHMRKGDGHWEYTAYQSDFVYSHGKGYQLLRPPCWRGGNWETVVVSM